MYPPTKPAVSCQHLGAFSVGVKLTRAPRDNVPPLKFRGNLLRITRGCYRLVFQSSIRIENHVFGPSFRSDLFDLIWRSKQQLVEADQVQYQKEDGCEGHE